MVYYTLEGINARVHCCIIYSNVLLQGFITVWCTLEGSASRVKGQNTLLMVHNVPLQGFEVAVHHFTVSAQVNNKMEKVFGHILTNS